jgi:hypothetical protein
MIDLVKLARDSIISHFNNKEVKIEMSEISKISEHAQEPEVLDTSEKIGVFVTLLKDGELRGCIGFPEPIMPLYEGVKEAAKAAAFSDPRFPEVEKDELKHITIEVSVLTVPEEIKVKNPSDYVKQIKIGEDGLIVRMHGYSGLLLPVVAVEYNMNAQEFLQETCMKAGLSSDAYKDKDCKVFKFQAKVYKEK